MRDDTPCMKGVVAPGAAPVNSLINQLINEYMNKSNQKYKGQHALHQRRLNDVLVPGGAPVKFE